MTTADITPATSGDITVNLEGLWLLQAMLGIAQLAPELRGRPYGQAQDNQWLTAHPGLSVLVEQGIADEGAVVRSDIAARMAVLANPDVEIVILVSHGPMNVVTPAVMDDPSTWRAIPDEQLRIVLARRDGRWASAVRAGSLVTIDDCPGTDQEWIERLIVEALDSVHRIEPARISAVNVPLEDMRTAVSMHGQAGSAAAKMAALRSLGLRGGALAELGAALEDPQAEALAYARAHVDTETVWSETVLNLRDTASGRVALYRLNPPPGTHQEWLAIAPATAAQLHHALTTVFDSVGVRAWASHERMG
ncbi:ESX secretion-associated protein EspG [Mycobacterium intracellulare]|uniref:ESX secretion-associated protein EspG n=1 Tax=Mycobacterium intracellulare TaxID=1767 RepID=A0AAE4RIM2_MYCIT|nr:ESX secretion-associated protein EspG [Mycobacterium intracellulare]MDV6979264.1 ESX secretion-associated protein EspG [Mycobacterium intracellulare]MDV6984769.1 ESX secretion-associated protein EspG [Mycobacterium intracellulare]MDV7014873.1 ESX secretion-associated protein EspG [Mycobacterium intracellulare]MDV7030525.1 ESX secretion-associated protein EspG [Mycobacterium intracellulare]